ncbi:MAG: hypothetical protein FWC50_01870 [Planctomycetaceae bacterium]|nr:hypothetical protein [Planctomycetaceae bacterium]
MRKFQGNVSQQIPPFPYFRAFRVKKDPCDQRKKPESSACALKLPAIFMVLVSFVVKKVQEYPGGVIEYPGVAFVNQKSIQENQKSVKVSGWWLP